MKYFYYRYLINAICSFKCEKIFSKKFVILTKFIQSLYDIETYIQLVKEFTLLKTLRLYEDELSIIESFDKILLNSDCFDVFSLMDQDINEKKINSLNLLIYQSHKITK